MEYKIVLEKFEGPLDLLLHLIEKSKVDIYDIPISMITNQYIQYINNLQEYNLEVASEFFVMAATLLEIKSKMLLPSIKDNDDEQLQLEELDPREELVRKLIEYKKYKNAAEELKLKEEIQQKVFFKPKEEIEYESNNEDFVIEGLRLEDLFNLFNKVIYKYKNISKKEFMHEIKRDEVTIEEGMELILHKLQNFKSLRFEDLFEPIITKGKIVAIFLGLLELIKMKKVVITQEYNFDNIIVSLKTTYEEVG